MAAGVPVLAADIPVSREVAGDAALYVRHDDVAALAEAMARGLDDAELRSRMIAAGRQRAARFTWDASALAHLALFDELASPAQSG
jgi:glycosyltransferase involved in cell wall biosynthesis